MERNKLFGAQSRHWTPNENEFMAEDEIITITPNFSSPIIHLLNGKYGPFKATKPIDVPLWLGITLKKSKKCTINPPEWLKLSNLKLCLEKEKENNLLEPLPFYYREIVKILMLDAKDDIPDSKEIRVIIQDIEDLRESKTKSGLKQLEASTYVVHLTNIASIEIAQIRHNVCNLLNYFYDISNPKNNNNINNIENNNTQESSNNNNTIATPSTVSLLRTNNRARMNNNNNSILSLNNNVNNVNNNNITFNTPHILNMNNNLTPFQSDIQMRNYPSNLIHNTSNIQPTNLNFNSPSLMRNNNNNNNDRDTESFQPQKKMRRLRK